LFTVPPSTISTTSIASGEVTRSPSFRSVGMFSRSSIRSICGPPPWITTGRIPTCWSRTTSSANDIIRSSSFMAAPPYFTTTVFP
jgi:hypothetical protein